jgi:hypothetical protein
MANMKMAVLWDVVPCSLVANDGGISTSETLVNFYEMQNATSQKTAIFTKIICNTADINTHPNQELYSIFSSLFKY